MSLGGILAFGAAFASALYVVMQHVASTAAPASVTGWRLVIYLLRNPLWLAGLGAVVASFVLQAAALYFSRLSVVQSILVTELVFTLLVGRVWLRRAVPLAAWASASATCVGLAVFLVMSEPKGGHAGATSAAWLPALLVFGGLAAGCALLAMRGSPVWRGALYAASSAIVSALLATFLKSTTDLLVGRGVLIVFERGELYGLAAAGFAGAVLTQAALHVGSLSVSQAFMVVVNPVVSIVLGLWLYGEHFTGGGGRIALGLCGFALLILGVVFLARTAPSFAAEPAPLTQDE